MGPLVAVGRTSVVHAYGAGAVVKVPRPEVPAHWAALEARNTASVRALGLPAPQVLDVVTVGGRDAVVFERIDGDSMWQRMSRSDADVEAIARDLAAIHREILSAGLPRAVPGLVDRMCRKIDEVGHLSESERSEAAQLARSLPHGAALLHGDLHPGNVLMGRRGHVVIDWFDAAIGHPAADVVRSSILIRPSDGLAAPAHLPGAAPEVLARVHDTYAVEMADVLDVHVESLGAWESVVAASRLAEGAQSDEWALVSLWERRASHRASAILEAAISRGSPAGSR
ncbi:MAG: aminoglycoside phosphotransferase family protein [Actinomycetota bacterium]